MGEAEVAFRNALDIARAQGAKSFELRAATNLARFLDENKRRAEARDMLEPVYNYFTEGFNTSDLKEAKSMLDAVT